MNVDPLECNIVKNCAATLAGLGTAGIFNADCPDPLCLENRLRELNLRLSPKGVKAEVLFFGKTQRSYTSTARNAWNTALKIRWLRTFFADWAMRSTACLRGWNALKDGLAAEISFLTKSGFFWGIRLTMCASL